MSRVEERGVAHIDVLVVGIQHHGEGGRRSGGDVEHAAENGIMSYVPVTHESSDGSIAGVGISPEASVGEQSMEVARSSSGHVGGSLTDAAAPVKKLRS